MDETYVHDGIEVVLTGRVAFKKLRNGKEYTDPKKMPKLIEIEPKHKGQMTADNKQWVSADDLYEIADK